MTPSELRAYANQGYTRVPVIRRALADLDTPLSVYLKLAAGRYSYLLESVEGGEKWGRYSIIGLPARTVLRSDWAQIVVTQRDRIIERAENQDPFEFVRGFLGRTRAPPLAAARFGGGLVGYFGYDTVRYVEPRLAHSTPPDRLGTPDMLLMVADEYVIFDNLKGEMQLVCEIDPRKDDALIDAERRLDELVSRLRQPLVPPLNPPSAVDIAETDFVSEFGRHDFMLAVEKIKRYIVDGDAFQVVPSQRMSVRLRTSPVNVYRALRHLNPSPYLFFVDLDEFQIVGSSPEILVRLDGRTVTTRPLAGTRKRGATEEEDRALEQELLADPKEVAEHVMLIDLGRNDVGRVAIPGTVRVTEKLIIERYSHVMHISSNVEGTLAEGRDAIDVLRATLPVGTLSGAPKIRAMEIIDELEPVKRGIYGGAVGYLSWNGNMDTAI
ncbi:MAG: anthranilate synthase component I family protein, partial [Gammaproteobacteria bacterium]